MRKSSSTDEKILSYDDVVLRRSDLDILGGPHFLNDRIIEFYFTHLSSRYPSSNILLTAPSISFWIANCPSADDLRDCVTPLRLPEKDLVLFPVNDNDDVDFAEGGSHWSLLVYERNANVFVHHDSSGMINSRHARNLFKAVVSFVGISGSEVEFRECRGSPQQMNGYDCGLYVTATARAICRWYENAERKDADTLWFPNVKEEVNADAVAEMRGEILFEMDASRKSRLGSSLRLKKVENS